MAEENKETTQNGESEQTVAEMPVKEAEQQDEQKVKDLRSEAAKYRTQKKEIEQEYNTFKEKVQSLFGENNEQDFESQVQQLKNENTRLKQEHTIRRYADKLKLDAELVTAKVMYDNAFEGVNINDSKEVEKVLKNLAEQNPRLVTGSTKFGDTEKSSTDNTKKSMNDFIRNF